MSDRAATEPVPSAHEWPVGYTPAQLQFVVTPELNQQYLFAEEDFDQRYLKGARNGQGLVHPALLLNMSNATRSPGFRLDPGVGGLHARDESTFLAPASVGDTITVRWSLAEKYEKRGRLYTVTDIVITDPAGAVVMTRRAHITYIVT